MRPSSLNRRSHRNRRGSKAHRLREALKEEGDDVCRPGRKLTRLLWAAMKRTNMPARSSKRVAVRLARGIVVGAKDRSTNRVSDAVVDGTDGRTLQTLVGENAAPGATINTDDHGGYLGMPFKHETVKHSVSEYVNGMAHTNGIRRASRRCLERGYDRHMPRT